MKNFINWLLGISDPEIIKIHEERRLRVIDKDIFDKFYQRHSKPEIIFGEDIKFINFDKPIRKKKPKWIYQTPL